MKKMHKTLTGRVVSDKMDKTVVVAVESLRPHSLYRKVMRHLAKLKAHDESNACRVGDIVMIEASRPLSKTKHWRIVETVSKGEIVEEEPNDSASD
jgi:small subunit ribosomal protein S17